MESSTVSKIKRANANLNAPTRRPDIRDRLLEIYRTQGYNGIKHFWKKTTRFRRFKKTIIHLAPKEIVYLYKRIIKAGC